jgi:hypothetical protein
MVKQDLLIMSKFSPALKNVLSSVLFVLISLASFGQITQVACDDNVQVSLDGDCRAVISPEMIVEGNLALQAPPFRVRVSGIPPTNPYADPIVSSPGTYTVTITNSEGNSCWGKIKVEDKLAPQVDCACPDGNTLPACRFRCTDEAAFLAGTLVFPQPTVDENCGSYTTAFADERINTTCGAHKIRRTWIFTDAYGNKSAPCISEYTFEAVALPSVTPPYNNVQLTCKVDASPAGVFTFIRAKVYADLLAIYQTQIPSIYANLDAAKAAATRNAIIEANRHAYPTVGGTPLSDQLCNLVAAKSDTELTVCNEACSNSKKVIRVWSILDWCNGTNTTMTQIIKATDEEAPTVDGEDLVIVSVDPWSCEGNFLMPAPTILHDNCSDVVTYTVEGPAGVTITRDAATGRYNIIGAYKGDNDFRYVAKDCCGLEGVFEFVVRVVDRTPPIAVAKQHIVLSLTTSGEGDGIAKLYVNSVDNGSYDSCTPVHMELRRERSSNRDETDCNHPGNWTYNNDGHPNDASFDDDKGAFVKFCCSDITNRDGAVPFGTVKVWMRVWDDGDGNGTYGSAGDNYNETWVEVRVEDKLTPRIVCPADITINCDDDERNLDKVGRATAYSNCVDLETEYTDVNFMNGCKVGYILRTWRIKNRPTITCTQRITKVNPLPNLATTIHWPDDVTTNCATANTDRPTWVAGPCDQIGVSLKSDTFYFESGACMKILNKWTLINWCTYDPNSSSSNGYFSHTQIIKVVDDVKPTLSSCADLMFEINDFSDADGDGNRCETKNLMLTKTADDQGQCASAWLKWVARVDLWGDGKYEYEYSSFLPTGDVTFDDTNGNGIPDRYAAPTGRNGEFKITIPEDIVGSMSNHRVEWKVTDGCGNVTTCNQNFMVVDKKKPTPYCLNVSSALMQNGKVELWAADFNVGSFDNCTAKDKLLFTLNEAHPVLTKLGLTHFFKGLGQDATEAEYNAGTAQKWIPSKNSSGMVFGCDDLPSVDVKLSVWDEKLNTDFCTVTLNLADNQGACGGSGGGTSSRANISGKISNDQGKNLANAEVTLINGIPEHTKSFMTNTDGTFAFDNNFMHYNYEVSAAKNDDYLNGVSTLDLVMIQRHVLGLNIFNSGYQTIAADINNDEKVTASDLTELRKLILGIYAKLPNNGSWRFINAGQAFADARNPWPINEAIEIANLDHNMINQNFMAVKIGDVNNTASTIAGSQVESRTAITLNTEDVMISAGQIQEITFAADASKVYGTQFTLTLNEGAKLEDLEIAGKKVDPSYVAQVGSNKYLVSWNTVNAVQGANLVTLHVSSPKDVLASKAITINSTALNAEIYSGDAIVSNKLVATFSARTADEFVVYQNEPNPFNASTTITFNLPKADNATLQVFDVTGKMIYNSTGSFGKGVNHFTISRADLPTTGVMIYKIESGQYTETKKMIGLE